MEEHQNRSETLEGTSSSGEPQKLQVPNPDNADLGAGGGGPFVFGFVDEVNGPKAAECPDFTPTIHEALELVKYWATRAYEIETFYFLYGQSGGSESRTLAFAWRRIDRIGKAIGKTAVKEVMAEVENEFRRRLGDRKWEVFQNGTPKDLEKIWEEVRAEGDRNPSASGYICDHLAQEAVKTFPEVPAEELATALRFAAEDVEKCNVTVPECEHDWHIDPADTPCGVKGGCITVVHRCRKCCALRRRNVLQGDPGYDEVARLAE